MRKTKRRRRDRLFWLVLLCLSLAMSGCWDIKDIDRRALPVAMGIDLTKQDGYTVYLKIPTLLKGQTDSMIMKRSSASISKAVDHMARDLDRSMDLLHVKLVAVSERLARKGIQEVVDYCMRTREIGSKTMFVVVRGDMQQTIEAKGMKMENVGASFQNFFSKNAGWMPEISREYLFQAFRDQQLYTEDTAFPILEAGKDSTFRMVGTAMMKLGRMVDTLTPAETLVFNIYRTPLNGGVVEASKNGAVRILSVRRKQRHKLEAAGPHIYSKIDVDVTVLERKNTAAYETLLREVQEQIKQKFYTVLEKSQRHHSDILGLGQYFRSEYTMEELKNWKDQEFPKLKLSLDVNVVLRNRGLTR